MLKPEKQAKPSPARTAATALGAIAIIAGVTTFLLYRFGVLGDDGSAKNVPPPAEQLLQQLPEPERKKAREQMEQLEQTPHPKPSAGA